MFFVVVDLVWLVGGFCLFCGLLLVLLVCVLFALVLGFLLGFWLVVFFGFWFWLLVFGICVGSVWSLFCTFFFVFL